MRLVELADIDIVEHSHQLLVDSLAEVDKLLRAFLGVDKRLLRAPVDLACLSESHDDVKCREEM